jgi:hypothetical protein
MGDNRPPVYIETINGVDVLIIRASAIGHPCMWELVAAGQGHEMLPVPAVLQRAFDEGNTLEPKILDACENKGVSFISKQAEGHLWLSDNVAIRYHPDGVGIYDGAWYVVEGKALSNELWQKAVKGSVGDVIDEYNWQLSSMMIGEQLPGMWAALNKGNPPDRETGKREPHPDEGKMHYEIKTTPPVSLTELQLKASLILEGVYGEDLTTSDRPCDSPDHWPCRFLHLRPQGEGEVRRGVLTPDDVDEVDRLVVEFLSFKGQADEAKARYEAARDKLVELAGDKYGYIQTDKFYVPIVNGTSVSTNTRAMSQELRDVIDKYKTRKSYRYVKGIRRLGM